MAALVVVAGATVWLRDGARDNRDSGSTRDGAGAAAQDSSGKRVLYWYDPMVPGQKFDKPGKSPFMDMQLVPKYAGDNTADGVQISSSVAQNLGVRVGKVEATAHGANLQAVGRVAFDEHDIRSVQTRVNGFIERLYVRGVGDAVASGQKVAEVYAPDLLAAQQEMLALANLKGVGDIDMLKAAARERVRLLGMNDAEINAVESSGTARRTIGLYAPVSGVVQELGMREGAQVMPGQTLMQIAGLNRVWIIAELPERDLARVRTGQAATIRFAALPEEILRGKIEYVYPGLDATARTGQVRIQLANPKGLLRPGMYAQVDLAAAKRETLVVPSEAVIATGTRSVVIVRERGAFRPADVTTGGEIGGRTEIVDGLKAGDEVVVSGQFLIDSEASLKGVLARLSATAPADAGKTDSAPPTVSSTAVVKDIDTAKGTVTLSHGPIAAMQWPAMTMTFKLRDPKAAQTLKPGANVTFDLKRQPEGNEYIVESIKETGK